MVASSSIGERAFLALTSRLLGVSERRLFRAVIGIKRAGQDHVHMGASREFSLTGLSFALAVDLQQGERILISFYVPGARSRVSLEGEVVRVVRRPGGRLRLLRGAVRRTLRRRAAGAQAVRLGQE